MPYTIKKIIKQDYKKKSNYKKVLKISKKINKYGFQQ